MSPEKMRDYLLGRLGDPEREAIESRFFHDDEFYSALQETEADLLDDWARGKLPPAEAALAAQRFSPAKRTVARRLAPRSPRRGNQAWWMALAAAVLAIAAITYWGSESIVPPARDPEPRIEIAQIELRTPATRGAAVPVFTVQPPAGRIRITAPRIAGYSVFRLQVESADRGPVAEANVSTPDGPLALETDAAQLPGGDYDVLISGRNQGEWELLVTYPIRISRQ